MTVQDPAASNTNLMLDLAYTAVFAALIISLAFVAIPVGTAGVPIVLQNAAIILTGLILGPRRGIAAAILFLGLGLLGLPVLAGGKSTLVALSGPTIGYLVGYLVSPFLAGLIAYLAPRNSKNSLLGFLILGGAVALASQYLLGSIGLVIRSDMNFSAALAVNIPFIIPDLIKLAAVIAIAFGVHTALPDVRGKRYTLKPT